MTDGRSPRTAFLAGERPDDVLVYLAASAVSGIETLAERGERIGEGIALVLDAERGRRVARRAMGTDPMDLAGRAMSTDGRIDLRAFRGDCPAAGGSASPDAADPENTVDPDRITDAEGDGGEDGKSHALKYVFAFAEERNEEVGGIYAEGDVIHAYAVCDCGIAYSDRWVARDSDSSD